MSKIKDFFEKAAADEAAKKEIEAILVGKKLNEVTDEQFAKLSEIAKKVGIDIAADEMKACLNGSSGELDDDELDSVAGGAGWIIFTPDGETKLYETPEGEESDFSGIGGINRQKNIR